MNRYIALQKIVEMGSFSKAAGVLGYTQSAMSQMIASLENELSIRLLNRSRTGVSLTVEGEELYPYLEKMIFEYNAVREKAKEIRGLETGVIRIGTIASISAHWMPYLLKSFQQEYPGVEFRLLQGDYSAIHEWIKTGAVDFGFINPRAVSGIETEVVNVGKMLAILPEDHPLASESVVSLTDLAKEHFILVEEGQYHEPVEAFKSVGVMPEIRYKIHDDYTVMAMVEAGLGVSILTEMMLSRHSYNIVCKNTMPPVVITIGIGYKDKSRLSMASKRFIEYMKKYLVELT